MVGFADPTTDCLESGEEAACPSRKSPKAGNNRGLRRWRPRPRPRPRLDLLRPTMGLRRSGASLLRSIALPNLKRKTLGSFSSVYDTYLSTKEVFEKHRVVFTVATSLGSLATAWAGYSLRYYHQNKVEHRLDSIEESMKSRSHIDHDEIKKIVSSGTVSLPACIATAGTTMIIGYGLGWRGGRWLLNRKFRREQLKALQQAKPKRWQFLRRPWLRPWGRNRNTETPHKVVETRGTSLKSEL